MTIGERVEALERGLSAAKRRNRILVVVLVVLAIGLIFTITTVTVQAQTDDNIIRAEGFELVDAEGNLRLRLAVLDSSLGPVFNENGGVQPGFDILDGGPMLGMYDEAGVLRAGLVLYGTEPLLWLSDMDWPGLAYRSVLDGRPMRGFRHNNGSLIWSTP